MSRPAGVGLRSRLGCWLHERWRLECALHGALSRLTGIRWQDLCNRIERLGEGGDRDSRVCDWQWTSELTVCRVFPCAAGRLCRHCFREWPMEGGDRRQAGDRDPVPLISVVIPVGGRDRHAALMAVLRAFLRQTIREIEIIVVEQGLAPLGAGALPAGVRYLGEAGGAEEAGFNKSRLLNAGVRLARAPWVLLHDADIVVPARYVEAILVRGRAGWEAVRPIRFLFYAGREESAGFIAHGRLSGSIERVTQNFPGASTAITREAYGAIGGHDEGFVGWGGEDTEFLDRLRTRRLFPGHFAPALHLWHPPAAKKSSGDRNQGRLDRQMALPAAARIRALRGEGPASC